jgi:hypothetical protein
VVIKIYTKLLYLVAALLFLFVVWYLYIKPVHASVNNNNFSITICHHNPNHNETLTFHAFQAYLGHLGTPHSGQTYDTEGSCSSSIPSPSPSLEPTSEPSSTPQPSIDPCQLIDVDELIEAKIEVPCPTESPSATPGTGTTDQWHPNNDPTPVVCTEIKETPTIWEVKRNNATSIHVKWSPVDPFVDHYKIEYGLATGIPLWNTVVEGTETDLNFLPFNHILWLRVAGTQNGCVGNFSSWIDP